jgi:hypothetical protein
MKNIVILLLVVAVAALGIFAYYQMTALEDLRAKLAPAPKMASLDLQEKCARQARQQFTLSGWDKNPMAGFGNHYNSEIGRCFVQIEDTEEDKTNPGTFITSKNLSDAFEGKTYAEYIWHSDKAKKYWEVPPLMCRVTLPSGEERYCHSSDEFDELVKVYMQ